MEPQKMGEWSRLQVVLARSKVDEPTEPVADDQALGRTQVYQVVGRGSHGVDVEVLSLRETGIPFTATS
jgi:hypothetical protein